MRESTRPETLFSGTRKRLLLVASTGGHLAQLVRIADRVGADPDSTWVTFDSPQSRSLLAGKRVLWVDYVAPRDLPGVAKAYRRIDAELDPGDFDGALSTGAAVTVAGLLWARRHRLPSVYIESVSRTEGPSLTGRIVRRLHLARTYTQHRSWATRAWRPIEPVLANYARIPRAEARDRAEPLRVLVTLGTIRPYRFDALVDRVQRALLPGDRVVWQLGVTTRRDLPGEVHEMLDIDTLLAEAGSADVVVTHAGVGTILEMIERGISPVVVPRRHEQHEHVDDHQLQIWRLLGELGIAEPTQITELTRDTLEAAASHQSVPGRVRPEPPVAEGATNAVRAAQRPVPRPGVFISWTRENGRTSDLAVALGLSQRFIYRASRFGLPGRYLRQAIATRRMLRAEHPDRVMLMLPPAPLFWSVRGAIPRDTKVIADLHTGFFLDPKWQWATKRVLRGLRRRGITAIVTNRALRDVCAWQGVDAVVLHDVLREAAPAPEACDLDAVGLLCPVSYANDEPIEAILEAARMTPELHWSMTGNAPEELRAGAPGNVTFTGFVEAAEYGRLVRDSLGVVALTTRPHTMQRAGYEAFNAGVPQLTSDFPELREFYGDTALFTGTDPVEIARRAVELSERRAGLAARIPAHRQRRMLEQSAALGRLRGVLEPGDASTAEAPERLLE